MVESIGMQQVLQLSSTVEKAQMAQQGQAGEVARAFDKEFEKQAVHLREQTHETQPGEEAHLHPEDRRQQEQRRHAGERRPRREEEERKAEPPPEAGHGEHINVVA